MEPRPRSPLALGLVWMLAVSLRRAHSQQNPPTLTLSSRVFVALRGGSLHVDCTVRKPANTSEDALTCYGPGGTQVFHGPISPNLDSVPRTQVVPVMLHSLSATGEYRCAYEAASAYWYVYVRDEGFKMPAAKGDEIIPVAVVTAVLLVFSVVGSVYVFRGHWIKKSRKTNERGNENKEEKKKGSEKEEDRVTDPSTSFYASLEPRTRSIYDELHPSAASHKPDPRRAKPKKRDQQQTKEQETQQQDDDQLESVYENY